MSNPVAVLACRELLLISVPSYQSMAAPSKQGATGTGLMSRTLERCKSGLNRIGVGAAGGGAGCERPPRPVAGCFPVYVGPERVRFEVRAEDASHPLFRQLLDDAEREYGHATRGIALPCDVDAYLNVLWRMERRCDGGGGDEGDDDGELPVAVSSPPPIWSLRGFSKGRAAAGYRRTNPRSSPVVARIAERKETMLARTQSYS